MKTLTRTSGTPYYAANGATIGRLGCAGTYRPVAEIEVAPGQRGTVEEIAAAVAEVLDLADLARTARRYTAEASYFHAGTTALGFRWLHEDEVAPGEQFTVDA